MQEQAHAQGMAMEQETRPQGVVFEKLDALSAAISAVEMTAGRLISAIEPVLGAGSGEIPYGPEQEDVAQMVSPLADRIDYYVRGLMKLDVALSSVIRRVEL